MATDTNLSKLTPEEFTNFFMEGLKRELSTYELQANKVGFLGYLMNMLGNITYDAKIYKDMLFKEAFPATAQQDSNIYLHGSIYGFKNDFATPAKAYGTLQFDFSLLPAASSSTVRQDVIFGVDDRSTEISVDNVIFSTDSKYTFVRERESYRTVVQRFDGTVSTYPSNNNLLTVNFDNFTQERTDVIEFVLPTYNYGSYYTYTFTVEDEFISGINVYVRNPEETNYVEYNVEKVKYLIEPGSETVFFNQTSSDTYELEFGSGIHGNWIPGAEIKVILYKTIGVSANFSQDVKGVVNYPIQMVVYNTLSNGKVQSTTLDPKDYLKVNFKYSEGGADPLSGESLRQALVNYIQTRDNFLSEDDFYNVIEKYTTDFRILFKKMSVQENVFYLQRAFRDEYQNIIRSRNLLPEVFVDETAVSGIKFTIIESSGRLFPGLYFYKIFAEDNFKNRVSSEEITASLILSGSSTGSVKLEWNKISGTRVYKIYGRTQDYEMVWETTDNFFTDTGINPTTVVSENEDVIIPSENLNPIESIERHPYVVFPDFYTKSGRHFVSPFMYKFNDFYNYYEGWLFYPELIVNFSSVDQTSDGEYNSANIPSLYLNLVYDSENKKTVINLKSYQSLSGWNFTITVHELEIYHEPMLRPLEPISEGSSQYVVSDESTFYCEYTENNGLIIDPIVINITAAKDGIEVFTGKTAEINQRYDITDLLQIPVFKYMDVPYLVDVPVVDYDEFYSNKALYLDKTLTFLKGFSFEELRLVSDSLQFRMLNTDSISSYLLVNTLVQGKNLFKGINYINNSNIKSISDIPETVPMNNDCWIIGGSPVKILSTNVDEEFVEAYQNSGYAETGGTSSYLDSSPYSIILRNDLSSKFASEDIIRIKYSSIAENNKAYHVLSSKYDNDENKTTVYVTEKICPSENDGTVYYAVYKKWRTGGPDNIAKWNLGTESWSFSQIHVNDVVTVSKPFHETFRYNSDGNYVDYELKLPLNLSVTIYADRDAVSQYGVNLEEQRKQIKLEVAKYLQLYMSGTDIVYYPSAIVEFIMEPRRIWIKGLVVRTFDSSDPQFEFINGIETYQEPKIRDNISPSKLEILKYGSAFFWWNVDDIEIKYNLDG